MKKREQDEFISNLTELNSDPAEREFTPSEISGVQKYLQMINSKRSNTVKKSIERMEYGKELSHIDRTLIGVTRSRYLRMLRGSIKPSNYSKFRIIESVVRRMDIRLEKIEKEKKKKIYYRVIANYTKKYGEIVDIEMKKLYNKQYKFKRTKAAKEFIKNHENYNIDFNRLFAYLDFENILKSNDESMKKLHYLIRILSNDSSKQEDEDEDIELLKEEYHMY